jgi:hypothetical protein
VANLDFQTNYEALMSEDSNYKVTISGLYGGSVEGILNAAVPIASANEFDSAKLALSKIPLFGKVFDAASSIGEVMRISGNDTAMSIEQTRKVWQESRVPQLSFEVTFWNINPQGPAKDKPINKVQRIYSGLMPTKRDDLIVSAPLGYKFTNDKGDAVGTMGLRMGKWFLAGGLVMMDANFTPSLEISSDGTPLYYTGTVTLEPYKMLTYGEFLGWFKKPKPLPVHGSNEAPASQRTDLDNFADGIAKQTNDFLGQFKKIG